MFKAVIAEDKKTIYCPFTHTLLDWKIISSILYSVLNRWTFVWSTFATLRLSVFTENNYLHKCFFFLFTQPSLLLGWSCLLIIYSLLRQGFLSWRSRLLFQFCSSFSPHDHFHLISCCLHKSTVRLLFCLMSATVLRRACPCVYCLSTISTRVWVTVNDKRPSKCLCLAPGSLQLNWMWLWSLYSLTRRGLSSEYVTKLWGPVEVRIILSGTQRKETILVCWHCRKQAGEAGHDGSSRSASYSLQLVCVCVQVMMSSVRFAVRRYVSISRKIFHCPGLDISEFLLVCLWVLWSEHVRNLSRSMSTSCSRTTVTTDGAFLMSWRVL